MIDTTEKNVCVKQEKWEDGPDPTSMTDEEWEEYIMHIAGLDKPEEKYDMRCVKCGYEEKVPAWIVGEFSEIDRAVGRKKETALECPKCGGAMYRKG